MQQFFLSCLSPLNLYTVDTICFHNFTVLQSQISESSHELTLRSFLTSSNASRNAIVLRRNEIESFGTVRTGPAARRVKLESSIDADDPSLSHLQESIINRPKQTLP